MKCLSYIPIIAFISIFWTSCSTAPDFERDNPYDRDPISDSLGLLQFPPSVSSKYVFTNEGLQINVQRNSFNGSSRNTVLRKNGDSDFVEIGSYISINEKYFLDSDIKKSEDIGYPLIYGLKQISSGRSNYLEIDFGEILELSSFETEDTFSVSWKDSVYLNDGFEVLIKKDNQYSIFKELPIPNTTLSIPRTIENLTSEFLIVPYKFF